VSIMEKTPPVSSAPHSRPQVSKSVHAPRAGLHPNWLLGLIASGAVAVLALWWHDTPSISGLGDWLTNAGRITGLGAGYAIVVLLALMARVPAVERGVGADRLARWHSRGGRYTVSLVVAHALLITWGYAVTDHHNVVSETGILWTQYADVLMATVAMLLLVGVGIASARAARKRLRYETWFYIHFYTYLATALAFSHQFSTGADFVDDLYARVVWGAMYAVVAALLIWYRFVTPIRQSLQRKLRVAAVIEENTDVTTIVISGNNLEQLQAMPGQFFRWRFLTKDLWWAANPYSISAVPTNGYLRITVKHLGEQSLGLRQLRTGTRVIAEGPYGAMTAAKAQHRKALLIAGGVGVTPMRALFETLSAERGVATLLIYRASTNDDVLFRDEFDKIAAGYGSRVIYAVGRRGSHHDIVRPGVLQRHVPNLTDCDVFVCGPKGLSDQAIATLRAGGVKSRRIHVEDFSF
jgi:predicted ferric reductase